MNRENIDSVVLSDLVNALDLFKDDPVERILDIKKSGERILSGWIGLYDIVARRSKGAEIEISLRYAYGDEILYQDLIDNIYVASLLTENNSGNRDRYHIYICGLTLNRELRGVALPVPERYLPGNRLKIIRYLIEEKDVKNISAITPADFSKLTGFSTEKLSGDDEFNPLISVIIPSFNSGSAIEQAIQSIINQTYRNIELIIIDGGSSDNTNEIVEKYRSYITKYVSEKDRGIFDAINKGTYLSKGYYSVFIGADDLIFCDGVERFVNEIRKNSYPDFLYGDMLVMRLNGAVIRKQSFIRSKKYGQFSIFHPALLISKSIFEEFKGFDISYRGTSDADFELKLITGNKRGIKVNHYFSLFREGGLTFLYKNKYSEAWEIFRKNRAVSLKFLINFLKFRAYKFAVKYFNYKRSGK